MQRLNGTYGSIEQVSGQYLNRTKTTAKMGNTESAFEGYLRQAESGIEHLKFSKHANERLNSRDIKLTTGQMERLNSGVEQARQKNIKESLVMIDNLSFIVNVKNNTVITAVNQTEAKDQVFTNIDGAVII